VSFVANPLLTPSGLFRLLLEDFGALSAEDRYGDNPAGATSHQLRDLLVACLDRARTTGTGAVIIIDEAQTLPLSVVEHLLVLGALQDQHEQPLQLVLVGQPLLSEPGATGVRALNEHVSTKARLMPLGRDECSAYVAHRLAVAGAEAPAIFTSSAIEMLYALSGGVPRLLNLLAERALQEAAVQRSHKVGPAMIDAAASALELLRGTTRRFRWFTRKVS
ncbi:MAG: ExeA family protein, partial [Vicinamibacterales bacterium]